METYSVEQYASSDRTLPLPNFDGIIDHNKGFSTQVYNPDNWAGWACRAKWLWHYLVDHFFHVDQNIDQTMHLSDKHSLANCRISHDHRQRVLHPTYMYQHLGPYTVKAKFFELQDFLLLGHVEVKTYFKNSILSKWTLLRPTEDTSDKLTKGSPPNYVVQSFLTGIVSAHTCDAAEIIWIQNLSIHI